MDCRLTIGRTENKLRSGVDLVNFANNRYIFVEEGLGVGFGAIDEGERLSQQICHS